MSDIIKEKRVNGITIQRTINGYYRLSTVFKNQLVSMLYIDYTETEALQDFKEHLKTIK